jgi:hypothetical protein
LSERLSYWERERLLERRSGRSVRPDVSWAEIFWRSPDGPHGLNVFEPIPTKAPSWTRPHVCLSATVQFLGRRRPFEEIDRVNLESRTWPSTHFVEHHGLIYEVMGGSVRHTAGSWFFVWRAAKNTAHARHFNLHPNHLEWDDRCDICRLEKNLQEAA